MLTPDSAVASAAPASATLTSFVGRDRELAQLRALLGTARLVTLTGPGGVGKSRLALQVAAAASAAFADGIAVVPLATVHDPPLVASTIAQTLGVWAQGARSPADALQDYLRDKELLLVLDNFEQVATASPVVSDLLSACSRLYALVTSRAVLHAPGEVAFAVPPLALPAPRHVPRARRLLTYDAVRLFVERARESRPDFTLTEENAADVVAICQRLDGLPLAIELAAARLASLSSSHLLARLERRLPFFEGDDRGQSAPGRTLRTTIAWSSELLDPVEQTIFRRLAVFVGGCTLEAAAAVCLGDHSHGVGDVLDSLIDKSLLQRHSDGTGGPRCSMLETIREYAREQLQASGERDVTEARHAAHYLAVAKEAEPYLRSAQPVAWLERVEVEHANLRAALAWSLHHDAALAIQLVGSLWWFWTLRGYWSDGRAWLARALQHPAAATATRERAKALYGAGYLAVQQGDYGAARPLLQESVAISRGLGDTQGLADALHWLGREFSHPAAGSWLEESLGLRQELADERGVAETLGSLGENARQWGDVARGQSLGEQSLAMWRGIGDKFNVALQLYRLGHIARHQHDYPRARALYQESLALNRKIGHKWGVAMTLQNLGFVEQHEENCRQAARLARESLVVNRDLGNKWGICRSFHLLAATAGARAGQVRQWDAQRAASLLGAAETLKVAIGMAWQPDDQAEYEHWVSLVRAALSEDIFAAAWAAGRALTLEQAIAFAFTEDFRPPAPAPMDSAGR